MTSRILGPLADPALDGVTFEDNGDHLVLRAERDLTGIASRRFARPSVHVPFTAADFHAPGVSLIGFAYTQFALPVRAGPGECFDFRPAANLRSPPAVMPLVIASSDGRVELLAPLDAWHEQVIAVEQTIAPDRSGIDRFAWGWHGDLDTAPAGFEAKLGIFTGTSVTALFDQWGSQIRADAGTTRPGPDADPLLTHLSYWTDNGAAYWYRTEPGQDITTTLANKVAELDRLGVPVTSVELDSWFYPHEISRSVSETGYLEEVPPTGMLEWTPRTDVLPGGVGAVHAALDNRPLVLHSRHISPSSPYLDQGQWWIDVAAHPKDPTFFRRWCQDAASWGATCIEQDWMMVSFFGTRGMREAPGRAMAWQRGLDAAAGEAGITLLWCMALPGDLSATVELDKVIAVRTSDDYRYAADPALLWIWYLTVNHIAVALELPVFKDCFFSAVGGDDDIDGDPHAELEALLSAMSAGVVGIGDRIGRTDIDVVSRVCRPDGRLVGPDRPITLMDRSFANPGVDGTALCWSSSHSTNSAGTWHYVVAINTDADRRHVTDSIPVCEIAGIDDEVLVYDWRSRTASTRTELRVTLAARDWAFFVVCPIETGEDGSRGALIGDPNSYATMGSTRVDVVGTPTLLPAEGEEPSPLAWWSASSGLG